jgi:GNAT superfamily N-acetyltransferase
MFELKRTDSSHHDFIQLVSELDQYLAEVDGDDHAFYNQYNGITALKHVVVLYENDIPVACGAIKWFDENRMEIKRMYTRPSARGKGVASNILIELEDWSAELGARSCVLETGVNQQEAIRLYRKMQYKEIENYGQYVGVENSFCFEKIVASIH